MSLQVVPYNSFHKTATCPFCGMASKRYATTTDYDKGIRFRYHRCENCFDTYKSVEIDRDMHQDFITVLSQVITGCEDVYKRESISA